MIIYKCTHCTQCFAMLWLIVLSLRNFRHTSTTLFGLEHIGFGYRYIPSYTQSSTWRQVTFQFLILKIP